MEIALHLGVHLTDGGELLRCLLRNRSLLEAQGIAIPNPDSYRGQLHRLAEVMVDQPTDAHTQEALLDAILDADDVQRVVFSNENFLAPREWAATNEGLYPKAGARVARLRHLFPEADVQIYLAIRDPASFLPALQHAKGPSATLRSVDPLSLRWSEMLIGIRAEVPDVPITVWRDEDTPLLWPEILRAVAGHDPETELEGWFAWYWDLLTPKTHAAMRRYFNAKPAIDDLHRRRVLSAMLERFARPETIETDIILPGWDEMYVDVLTELYEQDLDLISLMHDITFLEPY